MKLSLSSALISALALVPAAVASPMGASMCVEGQDSVAGNHLREGHTSGQMSDFGLELRVDGAPIDPASPLTYSMGVEHKFELVSTTGEPFKGFLFRFAPDESSDVVAVSRSGALDLSQAVFFPSNYTGLMQTAETCESPAFGITHTSREYKTMIPVHFMTESPVPVKLDVTVVVMNNATGSEHYHTGFSLVPPADAVAAASEMADVDNMGAMEDMTEMEEKEDHDDHDSEIDHSDHDHDHGEDYGEDYMQMSSASRSIVAGALFAAASVAAMMW